MQGVNFSLFSAPIFIVQKMKSNFIETIFKLHSFKLFSLWEMLILVNIYLLQEAKKLSTLENYSVIPFDKF